MLEDNGKFKGYCTQGMAGKSFCGSNQFTPIDFQIKRLNSQIKRCSLFPPVNDAASPRHLTNSPLTLISLDASRLEIAWRGRDLRVIWTASVSFAWVQL